jgi:predicted Ser/Thr protein kinase
MAELAPGSQFGVYRIESVAGEGGMGVVYRVTQLGLDRAVALKVITPAFAHDEEFRARFQRESKLAASIEHPNVIPVYEAGESDGTLFLAMRYVDGTDLKTLLAREGRIEPIRAARFVAQIANALDAAHAAGLVHRDVKPANVLLAAQDHVYLTDFGLTKRAASGSAMTKTGQMVGTVDYVAPEQVEGASVDARTDVYSLGCVLYHLLTGRVPFDKPTEMAKLFAHVHEDPPKPSDVVPNLPPELDEVVARGMAKEPTKRFLSAGDLGRAALAAAENRSIAEPERSVARGEAAPEGQASTVRPGGMPVGAVPTGAELAAAGATTTTPDASISGAEAAAAARGRNRTPWIVGAVVIVIAGIVVALVSGGGSGTSDTSTSSSKLPPGGQMTVINNAPPPKKGDKVLNAGETNVHGVHYKVVISTPDVKSPTKAPAPLYINEYLGKPAKLLQRLKMPHPFAQDSTIADFKVEANPDPNPDKTASLALSWFLHVGDQNDLTHYFEVTPHGIQID